MVETSVSLLMEQNVAGITFHQRAPRHGTMRRGVASHKVGPLLVFLLHVSEMLEKADYQHRDEHDEQEQTHHSRYFSRV